MAGGYPTYNLSNFRDMNQMRSAKEALEVLGMAQEQNRNTTMLPLDKDLKRGQIRNIDLRNTSDERTLPGVWSGLTPWQDVLVGDMMSKRPQLIDVPGDPRTIGSYTDPGSIPPPVIEDTFNLSAARPLGMAATGGLEVPVPQPQQVDVQIPGATTKALADVVTLPGTTTQYSPSTGMKWDALQPGFKDLGGVPGTEKRAIQVNGQTQLVDQAKVRPVPAEGSYLDSVTIDGATYKSPPPQFATTAQPKTQKDENGIIWQQDPLTAKWTAISQAAVPKPIAGAGAKPSQFQKSFEQNLAKEIVASQADTTKRIQTINTMQDLLDQGLGTGPVEGAVGAVTSFVDSELRSRREQFGSAAKEMAKTFRVTGEGAMSDRDVKMLLDIGPGVYKTEEANKNILGRLKAAAEVIQQRNGFIINAAENGVSAIEAQKAWGEYSSANPISYMNAEGKIQIIPRPSLDEWAQSGKSSAALEADRLGLEADKRISEAQTTEEKERIKKNLETDLERLGKQIP